VEELAKIADFIARHKITMTVENVAANPNREEEKPEKGSHRVYWSHWKCTFKRGEGPHAPKLETYYSMGHGNHLSERCIAAAEADYAAGRLIIAGGIKVCHPCRIAKTKKFSDGRPDPYEQRLAMESGKHVGPPPTCADVLGNLASDASMADNAATYEDFASELGYDPDSRKGERIYQACRKIADDLRRFLGNVDYDFLLYKVERE
jgi:hypothetical protein